MPVRVRLPAALPLLLLPGLLADAANGPTSRRRRSADTRVYRYASVPAADTKSE